MLLHSTQLARNLQDIQGDLAVARSKLATNDLVTDSANLKSIFNSIKRNLDFALEFMDQIARLDPDQVINNHQQAKHIQSLADSTQRHLFQARKKINKIQEDIPQTEKTMQSLQQIYSSFEDIVEIYSEQIQNSHISFNRLDLPDASLLANYRYSNLSLPSTHNKQVREALENFTQIETPAQEEELLATYHHVPREVLETFSPLFSALSEELANDVYLIYQDVEELTSQKENPKYNEDNLIYLKPFINSINAILADRKSHLNIHSISDVMQSDFSYSCLITNLIKSATYASNIKLSDLTKIVLTLQALRIKQQNQDQHEYFQFNLRSVQLAKSLAEHDLSDLNQIAVLREIYEESKSLLNEFDMKKGYEDRTISQNRRSKLSNITQVILNDEDIANIVNNLKEEFNSTGGLAKALQNSSSAIRCLLKEYKSIFIKANIDEQRLTRLTNNELRSMLEAINRTTRRCNSIDRRRAAVLMHILTHSFGSDKLISILRDSGLIKNKPNTSTEFLASHKSLEINGGNS